MPRDEDAPARPQPSTGPLLAGLVIGGVCLVAVLVAGLGGAWFLVPRGVQSEPEPQLVLRDLPPQPVAAGSERPNRAGVGEPVTIEGLTVQVVSAELGKAKLRGDGELADVVEDQLVTLRVRIELSAGNASRKYAYSTWRSARSPAARDELENSYQPQLGTIRSEVPDWLIGRTLSNGERATDTLAFQPPVESATRIDIDLPGENVGVSGTFRFRLPREAWAKK
jgi:hypothetical protein